jgi:uncharacterized Zn ribbon protein
MRTCPKCERSFDWNEYGRQTYCRECWRVYDAGKRREKTVKRKQDEDRRKLEDALALLPPDVADARREELRQEGRL